MSFLPFGFTAPSSDGVRILATRWLATALFALTACSANDPLNPSFPLRYADARADLKAMKQDSKPLQRPLVILGGIYDPGFATSGVARAMRRVTEEDAPVISLSFFLTPTFEECRRRTIAAVEATWPSQDPHATVELDVIGISMGGLIARYAALPRTDGAKRLRIARLFTLGTPHRGAAMSNVPTFDRRVMDMRHGSAFMNLLTMFGPVHAGEVFAYVRLGDAIVGPANAAPFGGACWWVANTPFGLAHMTGATDARFMADIARRLRGEEPWTTIPPAPLPSEAASDETRGTAAAMRP